MPTAYRICFVCSGNICRSPSAEVVFRSLVEQAGLGDVVEVDSAGTGEWHVGERADVRALRALSAAGYDGSAHRARVFDPAWFAGRELVIALDRGHARTLRAWAPDDPSRARVRLLRSYDPGLAVDEDSPLIDVADPYYEDDRAFTTMLEEIEAAGAGLLASVQARLERSRSS
ncbi:low molecular weight protein-tyrosine-phosphatase [Spongisporangium articulatum]|uniref:protein-tyrosine-phosphatase n=1 Tax=Spongisporangium articulatum TaxID=3362603 RepID=A0ABW8AHW3_9ACTN